MSTKQQREQAAVNYADSSANLAHVRAAFVAGCAWEANHHTTACMAPPRIANSHNYLVIDETHTRHVLSHEDAISFGVAILTLMRCQNRVKWLERPSRGIPDDGVKAASMELAHHPGSMFPGMSLKDIEELIAKHCVGKHSLSIGSYNRILESQLEVAQERIDNMECERRDMEEKLLRQESVMEEAHNLIVLAKAKVTEGLHTCC